MSELKKQIQRLKESSGNANALPLHKGRASLFLDAKKAAEVDLNTIYNGAVNGLMTLEQYEGKFTPYFETLLHQSKKDISRQSLSPEVISVVLTIVKCR